MNLNELHAAVCDALSKEPEGARLLSLAVEAERVADMTGWAIGPIDPQGRVAAAFGALKQQARLRYDETQSRDVAQLHDALAVLINAIGSHDDDLDPHGIGASGDDD
jgi:hypothetical protein